MGRKADRKDEAKKLYRAMRVVVWCALSALVSEVLGSKLVPSNQLIRRTCRPKFVPFKSTLRKTAWA